MARSIALRLLCMASGEEVILTSAIDELVARLNDYEPPPLAARGSNNALLADKRIAQEMQHGPLRKARVATIEVEVALRR